MHFMIRKLFVLLLTVIYALPTFAQQSELIPVNGYYIIQNKPAFKKGDCIFCNPETMPDRIILDSTKKMIAKKVSNPLGYTYYEWRNTLPTPNAPKSYEEILIRSLKFKYVGYYTDSGKVFPQDKNTSQPNWVFYFLGPTNLKQRYNGLWIAEKVRVQLSKQATDSMLVLYQSVKGKMLPGTQFWTELNFYENGKLQSTGNVITGLKESSQVDKQKELSDQIHTPDNQFRIGAWTYYHATGELNNKETITPMRKVNK